MTIVLKSEILRGYQIDEDLVCIKCVKDYENAPGQTVSAVISTADVDRNDDLCFYCDRCGELL